MYRFFSPRIFHLHCCRFSSLFSRAHFLHFFDFFLTGSCDVMPPSIAFLDSFFLGILIVTFSGGFFISVTPVDFFCYFFLWFKSVTFSGCLFLLIISVILFCPFVLINSTLLVTFLGYFFLGCLFCFFFKYLFSSASAP